MVFSGKNRALKRKSKLEDIVSNFESLSEKLFYLEESIGILEEESGGLFLTELRKEISDLKEEIDLLRSRTFCPEKWTRTTPSFYPIRGPAVRKARIWALMLMRMYLKWAEKHKFSAQVVELQVGEEAGIKSATIIISGQHAYGYLKSEMGVHRLVRISPLTPAKEDTRLLPLSSSVRRLRKISM